MTGKRDSWVAAIVRAADAQPVSIAGPAVVLNPVVAVLAAETAEAVAAAPLSDLWLAAGPAAATVEKDMYAAAIGNLLLAEVAAPDGHRYMTAVLDPAGWQLPDCYPPDMVPTGVSYEPCSEADAATLACLVAVLPEETGQWRSAAIAAVEDHRLSVPMLPKPIPDPPDDIFRLCGIWPLKKCK